MDLNTFSGGRGIEKWLWLILHMFFFFFFFCARRKINKEKWMNHPENAVLYFLVICFSERQLIKLQNREV